MPMYTSIKSTHEELHIIKQERPQNHHQKLVDMILETDKILNSRSFTGTSGMTAYLQKVPTMATILVIPTRQPPATTKTTTQLYTCRQHATLLLSVKLSREGGGCKTVLVK